jgi:hypothetical protein
MDSATEHQNEGEITITRLTKPWELGAISSRHLSEQVAQLDLKVTHLLSQPASAIRNTAALVSNPAYGSLSVCQITGTAPRPYHNTATNDSDMMVDDSSIDSGRAECKEMAFETTSGIKVTYTDPLPNIPAISFKDSVDQLFADWYSSRHLVLGGQAVAIQDWDKVYKGTAAWKAFKSTYSNFKVSLENAW